MLSEGEHKRPGTTMEASGKLRPSFAGIGQRGGFDAVALQKYHWVEDIDHAHTPGNPSGLVDGSALFLIGSEAVGAGLGLRSRSRSPRRRWRRRAPS